MNSKPVHDPDQTALKSTSLLSFLFRKRKVIISVCGLAAIISIIAAFTIEEKFKSSVIMFAARTNSIGQTFMSTGFHQDILEYGETEQAEQLLQIIGSDEIQQTIIAKYDLFKHYDIDPNDPGSTTMLNNEYSSNITSELTKYGAVKIEVVDKSPDTAMFIARDISALVDSVSNRLKRERAIQAVTLAKREYDELLAEITILETRMAELRDLGIYDYYTQIEGLNEMYATAVAIGLTNEAELLRQQMAEISKYGQEYEHIKTKITASYDQETRLKNNYDLLRFDVNSEVPAKFVVNEAQIPDKKVYPVRWLIVSMSVISAFIFTVILLLLFENYVRLQSGRQV